MEDNSWKTESWESGIKFVEEKRSNKVIRVFLVVLIVLFSASFGGIMGGYYVKKSLVTTSQSDKISLPKDSDTVYASKLPSSFLSGNSVSDVAEMVGPAVVGVENNVDDWGQQTTTQGSGSGIIFDKEGYIVTNHHVIEGATKIIVTLPGGERRVPAKLIGADKKTDLAVLKIDVEDLPVAKFGDSSRVRVGDLAIVIGNPLGQEYAGTVTVGVISGINRQISLDGRRYKVLQTDASINPGNSGGALCNDAGEVIGINSLKLGNAEGIGFAISINEAKPIIESLMKKGYVSRPFLGIGYVFIDKDYGAMRNIPTGAGIKQVVSGSAADQAGVMAGDIITEINGKEIKSQNDLGEIIEHLTIGDTIRLKVWRDGNVLNLQATLGDSKGQ